MTLALTCQVQGEAGTLFAHCRGALGEGSVGDLCQTAPKECQQGFDEAFSSTVAVMYNGEGCGAELTVTWAHPWQTRGPV